MQIKTRRYRGRPVYIRSGGETISLVSEVVERHFVTEPSSRSAIRSLGPQAVHVIDSKGVVRLPIQGSLSARTPLLLLLSLIAGPLQLSPRPPQVPQVSQVFGEPYEVGDKTLIPVSQVRRAGASVSIRPVAFVEVSAGKVSIKPVPNPLPFALGGMLLGAWNFYWLLKTVREWRRGR